METLLLQGSLMITYAVLVVHAVAGLPESVMQPRDPELARWRGF